MSGDTIRRVVGLDLSLTATGIATIADSGTADTKTVKTTSAAPMPDRIAHIAERVAETVGGPNVLVVMEDCVLRSNAALGLAMLHGVVRDHLWQRGITPVLVAPATLKVYAAGKGNADKGAVIAEAVRRLGYPGSSDNEADALFLAHLGRDLLGCPLVDLPQTHRRALAKLTLPAPDHPEEAA